MGRPTQLGVPAKYLLFLASGVAPMAAELLWMRGLAQGLGHETPAVLAVLAAMFAGAAAGALLLERPLRRTSRPGRGYAWLCWVMAGGTACSAWLVPWTAAVTRATLPVDAGVLAQSLVAFLWPLLALLPATAAWGASWVAMDAWLAPEVKDGRCLGGMAAAQTAGAALGVVAALFWLAPSLGLANSLGLVALLQGGLGAVAWSRSSGRSETTAPTEPRAGRASDRGRPLLGLAAVGLVGLGCQALVVRGLAPVFQGTVYSYGCVLVVHLVASTLGARWFHRRRGRDLEDGAPWWLVLLAPALSLAALLLWTVTWWVPRTSGWPALGVELGVAVLVMSAPAWMVGAAFAFLLQDARERRGRLGPGLACNALGAALGPVVFGALLRPVAGAPVAMSVLAAVSLGPAVLWGCLRDRRCLLLALGSGALLVPLLVSGEVPVRQDAPGVTLVARSRDAWAEPEVVRLADGALELRVDRRFTMGGTAAANAERRQAHLPLLLHPDPHRALFLGVGTGITAGAVTEHEDLRADAVELLAGVVELLPHFAASTHGLRGVTVHCADARRFVAAAGDDYDVIIGDVFHPGRDGTGSLFTREHFRAVRARLAPGGLFCQWLPLHQWPVEPLRAVVGTFLDVFPDTQVYLLRFNLDVPVIGLVGFERPTLRDGDWYDRRVRSETLRAALAALPWQDGVRVLGTYLGGAEGLREFARGAQRNTDDRPWITFAVPLAGAVDPQHTLDAVLAPLQPRVTDLLFEADDASAVRLRQYWQARDGFLDGLRQERQGRRDAAVECFLSSLQASADFTVAYAHLLRLAVLLHRDEPEAARRLLDRLVEQDGEPGAAAALRARLFGE